MRTGRASDFARSFNISYETPATTGINTSLDAILMSASTKVLPVSQPSSPSPQFITVNVASDTISTKKRNVVPQRLCCVDIVFAFSTVSSSPCS